MAVLRRLDLRVVNCVPETWLAAPLVRVETRNSPRRIRTQPERLNSPSRKPWKIRLLLAGAVSSVLRESWPLSPAFGNPLLSKATASGQPSLDQSKHPEHINAARQQGDYDEPVSNESGGGGCGAGARRHMRVRRWWPRRGAWGPFRWPFGRPQRPQLHGWRASSAPSVNGATFPATAAQAIRSRARRPGRYRVQVARPGQRLLGPQWIDQRKGPNQFERSKRRPGQVAQQG
jgi:hypothetical protein